MDRYGHGCWPDEDWGKKPDGPYVRYGDYLAMLARAERAERLAEAFKSGLTDLDRYIIEGDSEITNPTGLIGGAALKETSDTDGTPFLVLPAPNDMITSDELSVLDGLADAAGAYFRLPVQHPNEQREFGDAIHRAQDLIAVRVARAACPSVFPIKVSEADPADGQTEVPHA